MRRETLEGRCKPPPEGLAGENEGRCKLAHADAARRKQTVRREAARRGLACLSPGASGKGCTFSYMVSAGPKQAGEHARGGPGWWAGGWAGGGRVSFRGSEKSRGGEAVIAVDI